MGAERPTRQLLERLIAEGLPPESATQEGIGCCRDRGRGR
jgi:hypothetical protein